MRTSTLHGDEGFALATVLMAMLLLTVLAVGAFTIAEQSTTDSSRTKNSTVAFQAASSGLDGAISQFTTASVPATYTGTIGNGKYTVTVTKGTTNPFVTQYLFKSVGTAQGGTATVQQILNYTTLDLWGVEVNGDPKNQKGAFGSGSQFNASDALLEGPFYVAGDVSINSNVTIKGGPWFVTGSAPDGTTVVFKGGVSIDPSQTMYTNLKTVAAQNATNWTGPISYPCPNVTLPFLDQDFINGAYKNAHDESADNLMGTTGSANTEVTVVGSPTTYTGTRFATPSSSSNFYKIVSPSSVDAAPAKWDLQSARTNYVLGDNSFGKATDDFALVNHVLYVRGTVFVDGNLTLSSGVTSYQGYGTIVVNGNVTVNCSSLQPTGALSSPNPGDPGNPNGALGLTNNLGITAAGDITVNSAPFEGTMFADHTVTIGMNGHVWGTIHGASIIGGVHSEIIVESGVNGATVPPCMPGGSGDPRPAMASGQNALVLGTWSRQ